MARYFYLHPTFLSSTEQCAWAIISPKDLKSWVTRISFALLYGKTELSGIKYFAICSLLLYICVYIRIIASSSNFSFHFVVSACDFQFVFTPICFVGFMFYLLFRMSDNLPERLKILGHAHIICITLRENRIICCQIFCDLLLKSAFERIFNVMQLILF
jgi:hypothetical protein